LKRLLIAAVVAGALLAPGAASASDYTGGAKRGDEFTVSFQAVFVNGKPEEVRHFRFRHVPMTCEVGDPFVTKSGKPGFGPMNVNSERRFHGVFSANQGDVKVVIRGEFKPQRVVGTLRVSGDYPPDPESGFPGGTDCSSGRLEWTAQLS
jgi:hypothetical protein